MVTVVDMAGGIKPPCAVIAGYAVGEILSGQPFQYAVNGDAVHAPATINPLLQLLMRQCTLGRQQCRKHFDARRSHPGAGSADQRLGLFMMAFCRHARIGTRSGR